MLLERHGFPSYRPPGGPACKLMAFPGGLPVCLDSYVRGGVYQCPAVPDPPCDDALHWLLAMW